MIKLISINKEAKEIIIERKVLTAFVLFVISVVVATLFM